MKDRHYDELRSKFSPPTFGGRREGGHNIAWTMTPARPPARPPDDAVAIDSTRHKRGAHSLSAKLFPCGSGDREGRKGGESTGVFEILMGAQSQS